MSELRDYQTCACENVLAAWENARRVCLVCPTGGGKTRMGEEIVALATKEIPKRTLWLAHRRELIKQAAERLRARFGMLDVGIVMPGVAPSPFAPIQVASVQTIVARDEKPPADVVVFDEAHHTNAETYAEVLNAYPEALQLGLTATPERPTGEPLGDMFDALVVAAQYSELLRDGFLVPMRVFQPPEIPGTGYAQDPLQAWKKYAPGSQTFAFFATVKEAKEWSEKFNSAGIPAAYVEANTKQRERDEILERFRRGEILVLCNVYVFTEGTDVPAAETILLARACNHVSIYLQIAGRALRPAPGKTSAKLIDLTGASLLHGLPLEDREYSLDGNGIKRTSVASLKNCLQCGATILSAYQVCPNCGYNFPRDARRDPKIYDWDLLEVYAGQATPDEAKAREYMRLRLVAKSKGYGVGWLVREYRKLFKERPVLADVGPQETREEFWRLKAIGEKKGFKPGFAKKVFYETFGRWPRGDEMT